MADTVVFVLSELAVTGLVQAVLDLASALPLQGFQVELFALRPGDPSAVLWRDLPFPITPGRPAGLRRRYGYPVGIARLLRAARRADVVVSAWDVGECVPASLLAGRATRRPVVLMVNSDPVVSLGVHYGSGWKRDTTIWAYPRVDAAVCVSNGLVPTVVGDMGVPRERVRVIGYGLDTGRVKALAGAQPPDWLPEGPYVLGLGRLSPEKGFDLLIEAHARVKASGLDHELVIVGDGPERGALVELGRRLGVSDSVLLPGFRSNPFPELMRASLFCLPSRSEGWGSALAEALTLEVAMVATDCGSGVGQILAGGRYGQIVPAESAEALAEALASHLREPSRLAERARGGAAHAESFSVTASAEAYAELFRELSTHQRT
jgi:glycosyltransferase involved in cell wall biosynthesis